MTTSLDALARKLVSTLHLDSVERRAFPQGVTGKLLEDAVLGLLAHHRHFPVGATDGAPFDGALLVLLPDGGCRVTWTGEIGVGRYETIETVVFPNAADAVTSYVKRFFGREFDGIPIDWDAQQPHNTSLERSRDR